MFKSFHDSFSSTTHAKQVLEDPFFVVDLDRVIFLYWKWKEALPNITPFYAVKCNTDLVLLKLLAALGAGFDCASKVVLFK